MIRGSVGRDGLPRVCLNLGGREWPAVIDTGSNGDLELPWDLGPLVQAQYEGTVYSIVADGRRIFEDSYRVTLPFDGADVSATATFASVSELLIGTRLLRRHRLEIDFHGGTVLIDHVKPVAAP